MSINNVIITGTLARDPQLRYTQEKQPETRLDVICTKSVKGESGKWGKKKTIVPVVIRGKNAERVAGWFKDGSRVEIIGSIKGFEIPSGTENIKACAVFAQNVSSSEEK